MKDKTDAELIAKAEHRAGYFADNEMTLDDGHELAIELASRLKAANEKLAKVAQEDEDIAGMPSTSPGLARLFKTRAEALRR